MEKRLLKYSTATATVLLLKEILATAVSLKLLLIVSGYFLISWDPKNYILRRIEKNVVYYVSDT